MYDVIIIGAGVSGSSAARELSRYKVRALVLEKEPDLCCGTSKSNSAIVHAGYDAAEGSLMAKLNIEGNKVMASLAKELDIPFRMIGSFVVCLDENQIPDLEKLQDRGKAGGVQGLEVIRDKDRIFKMEPNLTDNAVAVLYAPTAGVICPFTLNIAMAENAFKNGVEFKFDTAVQKVRKIQGGWALDTDRGVFETKYVVNAAGLYSDFFHNMVSEKKLHITPRRGDYFILDRNVGTHVRHTIFPLPDKFGKGVLVSPTIHGNLIVGPTAIDVDDKESVATTREGLDQIIEKAGKTVKNLPIRQVITSFAGLRAHEDRHEFVIEEVEGAKGFVDCAGIESPGLASSPAVGKMVAEIVSKGLGLQLDPSFDGTRKGILHPSDLTKEEREDLIRRKPEYGSVICRCETVTEGEILDAIRRPLGARTLDGIKRRTMSQMGRCQAGFCAPRIMEILNRELGIPMTDITKNGGESAMLLGSDKDVLELLN